MVVSETVTLEVLSQSREMWLFYYLFLAPSAQIQPQDHCQVVVLSDHSTQVSSIQLPNAEIWHHHGIS